MGQEKMPGRRWRGKLAMLTTLALCLAPVGFAGQKQSSAKKSQEQKPAPVATVSPSTPENGTPTAPASESDAAKVRDPFAPLLRTGEGGGHLNLPPGIAGLQIATLKLEGMVKSAGGMIAVVANPQDRVYFIHDGDQLYDGEVEKISLDEITFKQINKDAFGRTVEREVTKRLYPIAGEEQ